VQTSREARVLAIKNLPGAAIPPRAAGSKIRLLKKAKNLQSTTNHKITKVKFP
jgi:hypothetical protein